MTTVTAPGGRPVPPPGARHAVLVTLDSCRYDTFAEADLPHVRALGPLESRYAYASWTAPSHYNLLLGLLPHRSPRYAHAGAAYVAEFRRHEGRFGFPIHTVELDAATFYFPEFLRGAGYETHALVSMEVIGPGTPVNRGFDTYRLMPKHNDMAAIVDAVVFPTARPSFWLLNVGETHYPYATADEDPAAWPRLSGTAGIIRALCANEPVEPPPFFTDEQMRHLRARQMRALESTDAAFARLFAKLPHGTWICITADHGELFGEDGYFGHGPIQHPKVFEVPFVEAIV
jgi:arylsulfatase A-like enzyme